MLFESILRRSNAVLKAKGGKTSYNFRVKHFRIGNTINYDFSINKHS